MENEIEKTIASMRKYVGDSISHTTWCDWMPDGVRCNCSALNALEVAEPLIVVALTQTHNRAIAEAVERMQKANTNILSGYCKCCGEKPCDHSTTGCPWEYKEFDVSSEEITRAINDVKKLTLPEA